MTPASPDPAVTLTWSIAEGANQKKFGGVTSTALSIDTGSSPVKLNIPDLTGVSVNSYTFTITATCTQNDCISATLTVNIDVQNNPLSALEFNPPGPHTV